MTISQLTIINKYITEQITESELRQLLAKLAK